MKETFRAIKELLEYLWRMKKWWLIPVILLLIIIGLLIILNSTTPVPVFIYPIV
jgi:uncharacterized integral membrane protein